MSRFTLSEAQVVERWTSYTQAFTSLDPRALEPYVAEDVVFVRGNGMAPWRSREEFQAFHGPSLFRKYCDETLRPTAVEFLHMPTESEYELCYFIGSVEIHVTAREDWLDPPDNYPAMRAGDEYWLQDRLIYAMDAAGKIVAILALDATKLEQPLGTYLD